MKHLILIFAAIVTLTSCGLTSKTTQIHTVDFTKVKCINKDSTKVFIGGNALHFQMRAIAKATKSIIAKN